MSLLSALLPLRPELQLYGKLPIAKDYLRIGCSEGTALAWREWLDRVFSTGGIGGSGPQLPWPMHFVIGAEGGEVAVGSLWNSSDTGGERRFPFTLFVRRKRGAVRRSLANSLVEEVGVWEAIEGIRERIDRYRDGKELLREERGKQVVPSSAGDGGALVPLDDWLEALWPERRLDGAREMIEEFGDSAKGGTPAPKRLPLAPRLSVTEQVRAWLMLLESAGCSPRSGVPSFFLPQLWPGSSLQEEARRLQSLIVFFSPLQPADIELLAADDSGESYPFECSGDGDVSEPSVRDAAARPLVESLRAALGGGDR